MRIALASRGIAVNTVAPAAIETDFGGIEISGGMFV
jgi:NAD(P)-dependent dehydrogenase (short-subunit alcohol dehydrogenase family)